MKKNFEKIIFYYNCLFRFVNNVEYYLNIN